MRLAKSIDELYEEVKDYDVVLCNDAPLSLALNNRLDQTRIGIFAITPRQLAGDMAIDILGQGMMDDIEVVKKVSESTGYRLRYVHGEIENIKTIMRYTSEVRSKLSRKSQRVYDEFIELPTLEKAMISFDSERTGYFVGKKVAVIGEEFFDNLDKNILPPPDKHDEISLFKRKDCYEIDEIRELSNDRQIAENIVSLINKDNAKDFAIVFDVGGRVADAIRSALYRKEIPFINSLNVKDLSHVRDFIEFLSLSLSFETVKVSQVRELISSYGGYISSKFDEYLVKQYSVFCEDERTKFILSTMDGIRNMTYAQVCDAVSQRKKAAQINLLLDELNLKDVSVNDADTGDIIYAVNNIPNLKHNEEIPDSEKEGVLLVDCKNSVFVDRPVVIFVGMGQEWEKDLSFLNLIDYRMKDSESDRNVSKFEVLLQQGSRRLYVVNSIKDGEKTKPCNYFDFASFKLTKEFGDVCKDLIPGPWVPALEPQIIESGEISYTDYIPKPFSKTSYGNFVSCPREFMYSVILGSPDNRSNVVGNILHEYAEFRITYPDLAKKHDIDYYSDIICDKCEGLFSPEMRSIERTNIRNSIINIDRFVNEFELDKKSKIDENITKNNVDDKRKGYNLFIDMEGMRFGSDITEITCTSADENMKGIFDVVLDGRIFDFKTGSPKEAKDIIEAMNSEKKSEYNLEFQCMFYLSLLEEKNKEGQHVFSLFYTNDNLNKNATGADFDIKSNMRHVELIDDKEYFIKNHVAAEKVKKKTYMPLEGCKDGLVDLILNSGSRDSDTLNAMATSYIMSATGLTEKKSATLGEGFVKEICNNMDKEMFYSGDRAFVTRKALEDFRAEVKKNHELVKESYLDGFIAKPLINCNNCYFNDICTETVKIRGETDV